MKASGVPTKKGKKQWLNAILAILGICILIVAVFAACADKVSKITNPQKDSNVPLTEDIINQPIAGQDTASVPVIESSNDYLLCEFPFNESPALWRGADGERTDGGPIDACNQHQISSHSMADFYARDFSRIDRTQEGKAVFASTSGSSQGYVIRAAWTDAYGRSVVIYYPNLQKAIRYSHLQDITVSLGQWIYRRTLIGHVGNSGCGGTAHLHMCAYAHVNPSQVPYICMGDYYMCRTGAWR